MMTDVFVVFGVSAKGKLFRHSVHATPQDAEDELRRMADIDRYHEYYVMKARALVDERGDL